MLLVKSLLGDMSHQEGDTRIVPYLQVHSRISQMAPVTKQEVQSRGDHGGHGQREQDDTVKEHRGNQFFRRQATSSCPVVVFVVLDFNKIFSRILGISHKKNPANQTSRWQMFKVVRLVVNNFNGLQS